MKTKADFFLSDNHKLSKCDNGRMPFIIPNNLHSICSNLNLQLVNICLSYNNILDWEGYFFQKTLKNKTRIFSGGRFGFSGFYPVKKIKSIYYYLDALNQEMKIQKIQTGSFTATIFDEFTPEIDNQSEWVTSTITYFIAKTSNAVNDKGLILENFKKNMRRNIRRNLKKSIESNLSISLAKDQKEIKEWHQNCHLRRIDELKGKHWDIEVILSLVLEGSGKLITAKNMSGEIIGGCIVLYSDMMLEIFMLSTPQEYQKLGVNYLIVEFIYRMAYKNGNQLINWQASNPPDGEAAKYKMKWLAEPKKFNIFSINRDKSLSKNYLDAHFKDCFVYPFNRLRKRANS